MKQQDTDKNNREKFSANAEWHRDVRSESSTDLEEDELPELPEPSQHINDFNSDMDENTIRERAERLHIQSRELTIMAANMVCSTCRSLR